MQPGPRSRCEQRCPHDAWRPLVALFRVWLCSLGTEAAGACTRREAIHCSTLAGRVPPRRIIAIRWPTVAKFTCMQYTLDRCSENPECCRRRRSRCCRCCATYHRHCQLSHSSISHSRPLFAERKSRVHRRRRPLLRCFPLSSISWARLFVWSLDLSVLVYQFDGMFIDLIWICVSINRPTDPKRCCSRCPLSNGLNATRMDASSCGCDCVARGCNHPLCSHSASQCPAQCALIRTRLCTIRFGETPFFLFCHRTVAHHSCPIHVSW